MNEHDNELLHSAPREWPTLRHCGYALLIAAMVAIMMALAGDFS